MNRSVPPERVPTLTEVLDQPTHDVLPGTTLEPAGPQGSAQPVVPQEPADSAAAPNADEAEIAREVVAELQAHIDRVLEARLRAALGPILLQATEQVLVQTRRELASTLHDGMARAVARQVSRHRNKA